MKTPSEQFEREERYQVIKLKSNRQVSCVVVEADWPEYEIVWQMIQDRVEGRPNTLDRLAAENAELKQKLAEERNRGFAMSSDIEDMLATIEALQLRVVRLVDALCVTEPYKYKWSERHEIEQCKCCGEERGSGHAQDCVLENALSAFEQAKLQEEVAELKQRLELATKTIEALNTQIDRLEGALFPFTSDI